MMSTIFDEVCLAKSLLILLSLLFFRLLFIVRRLCYSRLIFHGCGMGDLWWFWCKVTSEQANDDALRSWHIYAEIQHNSISTLNAGRLARTEKLWTIAECKRVGKSKNMKLLELLHIASIFHSIQQWILATTTRFGHR